MATKKSLPRSQDTQQCRAVQSMYETMTHLGFNLEDENFRETPERFVKYLQEFVQGSAPIKDIMSSDFEHVNAEAGYSGLLAQKNIPFNCVCPHHLLPVTGTCAIGYIPNKRLIGLSKLTRLVAAVGQSSPQLQEDCTNAIANAIVQFLDAKGVIVTITAYHGCMQGRGVRVHVPTITSTVRGIFRDVPAARQEFFELLKI